MTKSEKRYLQQRELKLRMQVGKLEKEFGSESELVKHAITVWAATKQILDDLKIERTMWLYKEKDNEQHN